MFLPSFLSADLIRHGFGATFAEVPDPRSVAGASGALDVNRSALVETSETGGRWRIGHHAGCAMVFGWLKGPQREWKDLQHFFQDFLEVLSLNTGGKVSPQRLSQLVPD